MELFSDKCKVINYYPPVADAWNGNPQADIVHLENYKKCTFIVLTGAAADNINAITAQAGVSVSSCATEIAFKYRKVVSGDTYGTLTDAVAGTGVSFTASTANQYVIVEIDAQVVAAAGTGFDCCAVTVTEAGTATAQLGCIVCILSEPRYPQDGLVTGIV